MKTTRPASTPSTAAELSTAAAEAKAGEESPTAPVTLPAPDGIQTARSASTSPAAGQRTAAAGAKEGEGLITAAPETLPALSGPPATGPASTSSADADRTRAEAKAGKERPACAPVNLPAPGRPLAGTTAALTVVFPAAIETDGGEAP